jgi:LysM repeat protein
VARLSRLVLTAVLSAAACAVPAIAYGADSDVYVVKNGDSLSGIAAKLGVQLPDLLSVNDLTVDSLIVPGQHLEIPGTTASGSPVESAGLTYTVRAGDSLSDIAARYQVTLVSLLGVNDLTVNSLITPGMQLTLPAGATVSPIERVLNYALAQSGKPYRFFTAGPDTFDCSGLTLAAYAQIGVTLIHHSASQAGQGTAVDFAREPIRAGDLIFMVTDGDDIIDHVGIAIDATRWIQAQESAGVVRIAPLPSESMIIAVRRFIPAD